jgi:hypothetical protein
MWKYLSKKRELVGYIVVSRSACEISLDYVIMSSCDGANIIQINYFISQSHDEVRSPLCSFSSAVSCTLTSLEISR